ncbi:MAG: multicopper oxidase family protein, partial [Gemmatimonadetes bacterium]|nr:multicopper oxidase family protein [Gemmatimonadota bacterium]
SRGTDLPAREVRLVAEIGEADLGPLGPYRTWMYNGRFPGQEIRVREGERLRVVLENGVPESTTVHWHGVPVPNRMDGVPAVTQEPVRPGESFVYEYVAEPAGSYMYHSHVALQLDRGLLGPLIIEERSPHVDYDREYTVVLDDLLTGEPRLTQGRGSMMMGRGAAGPEYQAFLINGRPPADPSLLEVRRGERVRLRLINPASQTTFRVALAGHRMTVVHADSRPVEPIEVDAVLIGMGERYDVIVEAGNPGAWNLVGTSIERQRGSARAVLRYADASANAPAQGQRPAGISGGRLLTVSDLTGTEPESRIGRDPDRTFALTLSSRMMSDGWFIDGEAFPEAEPLEIHEGERVRVSMTNRSMMLHPMHLHGHFFRVGNALKETVIVPPHMGQVTFDFTADNPGDWLFHCHNL